MGADIVDAVKTPVSKAELRAQLLAARRAVPPPVRTAEADALTAALLKFVTTHLAPGATVCAYVPVGSEPGSAHLLDALVEAGMRVLLPVVSPDDDDTGPLRWAPYIPGGLATAKYGLLEPSGPSLGPAAITEAQTVIVPAVAVDRAGARLGRGAGFYDRTLPLRAADATLVAVVRDDEVLDEVPTEPHDVPMTHLATPARGVVAISV